MNREEGIYIQNMRRVNGGKAEPIETRFYIKKGKTYQLFEGEGCFLRYINLANTFDESVLGHWQLDAEESTDKYIVEKCLMVV